MKRQVTWLVCVSIVAILSLTSVAGAAPPWKKLIPFAHQVEADPAGDYWLTDNQGPWMILATTFAGPEAETQAQELVVELRQRYNLPAYLHRREFDYTQPEYGLGVDKYGNRKRMRPLRNVKFDEIAVLVGDYPSVEAPEAQSDLERIKTAKPACLDITKRNNQSSQRFIGLRELQRLVHMDAESKELGPMRRAFVARNPLLPKEYFVPTELDPLVLTMNRNVEYSLLRNPGRYTVQVASFRGKVQFDSERNVEQEEERTTSLLGIPVGKETSQLEQAAIKAHKLTEALRKRGIEAYEFHDRTRSIVTVGSYDIDGTPQPDGTKLINPEILRIIKTYGPERKNLPGQGVQGLKPRSLDGIPFDVQPLPIEVPRVSTISGYAARD